MAQVLALVTSLLLVRPSAATPSYTEVNEDRTEFAGFPLLGFDSDYGVSLGALLSLARLKPYAKPYLWRLEFSGVASLKQDEGLQVPFQDYTAKFIVPALAGSKVGLTARAAYLHYSTLQYNGIGNASTLTPGEDSRYAEYGLMYPRGGLEVAHAFAAPFSYKVAVDYAWARPAVRVDSKLYADLRNDPLRILDRGPAHMVLVSANLNVDTRDNDLAPRRGQFHTLALRLSPEWAGHLPYAFIGGSLALRFHQSLGTRFLVLAARLVGDALAGDVPFFHLAESVDGYALGGATGVRGVPAQRYYGKLKAYGSLELRGYLPSFRAFGQDMTISVVAFLDGGRLWADWHPEPALDGALPGLKYGAGGGARLHWGRTFVVRFDAAYSPDAAPVSYYFAIGQAF